MVSLGLTSDANLLNSSRSWRLISDGLCQMARMASSGVLGACCVEVRGRVLVDLLFPLAWPFDGDGRAASGAAIAVCVLRAESEGCKLADGRGIRARFWAVLWRSAGAGAPGSTAESSGSACNARPRSYLSNAIRSFSSQMQPGGGAAVRKVSPWSFLRSRAAPTGRDRQGVRPCLGPEKAAYVACGLPDEEINQPLICRVRASQA